MKRRNDSDESDDHHQSRDQCHRDHHLPTVVPSSSSSTTTSSAYSLEMLQTKAVTPILEGATTTTSTTMAASVSPSNGTKMATMPTVTQRPALVSSNRLTTAAAATVTGVAGSGASVSTQPSSQSWSQSQSQSQSRSESQSQSPAQFQNQSQPQHGTARAAAGTGVRTVSNHPGMTFVHGNSIVTTTTTAAAMAPAAAAVSPRPVPPSIYAPGYPSVGRHPPHRSLLNALTSGMTTLTNVGPGAGIAMGSLGHSNNTVPEFLYQLTKMLTDNNRECIEWSKGKIDVHNPPKLASDVLHKYFRHSKYASFQRQLNYFGFRKLAGKGKMAPCSYINEAVTEDLRSLLTIKRKTTATKANPNGGSHTSSAVGGGGVVNVANVALSQTPLLSSSPPLSSSTTTTDTTANTSINTTTTTTTTIPGTDPILTGIAAGMYGVAANKRMRFDGTSTGTGTGEVTVFKVPIGKGVKHQMNGYLKGRSDMISPSPMSSSSLAAAADSSSSVGGGGGADGGGGGGGGALIMSPPASVSSRDADSTTGPTNASAGNKHLHPSTAGGTSALASMPLSSASASSSSMPLTFLDPPQLEMDIAATLNELKSNYESTLQAVAASEGAPGCGGGSGNGNGNGNSNNGERDDSSSGRHRPFDAGGGELGGATDTGGGGGMLSRNSSLVDLAMLPTLGDAGDSVLGETDLEGGSCGGFMSFVDFPNSEVDPSMTNALDASMGQPAATDIAKNPSTWSR